MLIPRIDLTSTTESAPVANPAQSLLVYNKNTKNDVTPGFYYWEVNKWVRVMSSNIAKTSSVIDGATTIVTSAVSATDANNTEYKIEVDEAALKLENIGGSLNPKQIKQGNDKQVLVSKINPAGVLETMWVDASEVIGNGIVVGDGLTKTGNEISLGGKIDSDVILDVETGGAIKIKDLPVLTQTGNDSFNVATDQIMVLNADGTLKQMSVATLINNAIEGSVITGKNLTGDNSIEVTTGEGAVLKNTSLKVKDYGITTEKLADDAVTADKINANVAGAGLQQNANGALEVNLTTTGIGKTLTTDDVIQITGSGALSTSSLEASVLKDMKLEIGKDKITSNHIATGAVTTDEILDGTIQAIDMRSEGNAKVMVTDNTGVVTWIDQTALGNTVTVDNGLTKTLNNIQLGGTLIKATAITTDGATNKNTFAIEGLQQVATVNNLVVVQNDGVLRTTTRSISTNTTSNLVVANIPSYSPYTQEVNISATAGASNFDITLPSAAGAIGQVINIKLTNTTEVDGYVSIKVGTTELTYGSLPYQGWIIKSNGTNWDIVGRN